MKFWIRLFAASMILAGSASFFVARRPDLIRAASDFINGTPARQTVQDDPLLPPAEIPVREEAQQAPQGLSDKAASGPSQPLPVSSSLPLPQQQSCVQTPTSAPVERTIRPVYQWVDERGRTHFGDSPPRGTAASELDVRQPAAVDYFSMAIDYGGARQVPYLEGRLTVSINKTFSILADLIGRQRLKAVELDLTILPDEQSFLAYGGNSLGYAVVGYYSANRNEVVTWQHDDPQLTLEVGRHESVHAILAGLLGAGHIPLWLNEGLAEYFSVLETRAQVSQVQIDEKSLAVAKVLLKPGFVLDFDAFLNLDRQGWAASTETNYPLSSMLVFFLMDSEQGRGALASLLQTMADHYCLPVEQMAVLEGSYPGGVRALDRDFRNWVRTAGAELNHEY